MDHESLNWFRFAKCVADVGNSVLRRYLYFHASTCSLSGYHDIWQQNVNDHCQSNDLNVLWTLLNQHSLALSVTDQQIFQPLIAKWKGNKGLPKEIRKQLSSLELWEKDLRDTVVTNEVQRNTLNKMSSEIQNLVTEHCLLLTAVRTWTKDFINVCHTNQSDLLHLIEQHNERTHSLLSTFLRKLDVIVKQGSDDLKDALQTCQQDDGNSSSELKTNIHKCFISWKLNIDKLIDPWTILQHLLTCTRNDLQGVQNTCQVNVNNICSTWHTDLQNELAELNHQLQQVGQSKGDQLDLARKLHEKLEAFPSVYERHIKAFFDSKETDLKKLKKRHILTEPQWSLMFPSQGSIDLEAFDITLSSALLRNICSVYPPELGWSGKILDTDHSVGADLMRLKHYRNNYVGHISDLALPNSDFKEIWGILETVLHRLSMHLGNAFWQNIKQKIIELRTCPFDDHANIKLQLELLDWYKSDSGQLPEKLENLFQFLEEKLHNISNQNVVILSELQHLTTQIRNINKGNICH
ncbi:hypothetical protein ACJMK2_017247 [Sinanodonta woodiana]|uniref:DZIP3-like HEPN domain-containing protein n=1 Tax=Sinanodonta woodiana TaxID=1069815 RepID=A0ABD3UW93_SINWO